MSLIELPFDLRSVVFFQRFIDSATRLFNFCHGYIDNLLVVSRDKKEHRKHLEQISTFKSTPTVDQWGEKQFAEEEVEYQLKVNKEGIC